jgi:hypothetical protein
MAQRGRPEADDYPRQEFIDRVQRDMRRLRLSMVALSQMTGIVRGTLSHILHGARHCPSEHRFRILQALGVSATDWSGFVSPLHGGPVLIDPLSREDESIERGQHLLACGAFPGALVHFSSAYERAAASGDLVLQAHAAARVAWLYDEMDEFGRAFHRVDKSISLVERQRKARLAEVVHSVQPEGSSGLLARNYDLVGAVLNMVLHIRCRLLTRRLLYDTEICEGKCVLASATEATNMSLVVSRFLQDQAQLGYGLRWQACLVGAACDSTASRHAERLLAESQDCACDALDRAYVRRHAGVVAWQAGQSVKAQKQLSSAIRGFALFADSRALGPAHCVLSKVYLQELDYRAALTHALAGAMLHPFGLVLQHARALVGTCDDQLLRAAIAQLRGGKEDFQVVQAVWTRLANEIGGDSRTIINQNFRKTVSPRHGWALEL